VTRRGTRRVRPDQLGGVIFALFHFRVRTTGAMLNVGLLLSVTVVRRPGGGVAGI
jgi:hypothetical protein